MTDWTYLLADLRSNAITAELPLSNVTFGRKLGESGTLNATLTLSRKFGGDPYTLTTPARTALYVLRDGRPMWGGILWTRRYDSTTATVAIGGADWWSYFDHRKVLPVLGANPSTTAVAQLVISYTGVAQNQIARNLVALAQAHVGGDLGIVMDATTSGVVRDATYLGNELHDVGDALRKLSQIQGGPDVMFDVGANLDGAGRPIRVMRLGSPLLGQMGSPWVFEYGANIISYEWPSDGTRMATRSYAVGAGTDTSQLIAVSEDTARYGDGWPMLETDISYITFADAGILQAHADGDQHAARLPVVLPRLTVRGDGRNAAGRTVGPTVADYSPGDDARVVIKDMFFRAGITTTTRIVAVDVTPGDDAPESATLTMNPISDDVA